MKNKFFKENILSKSNDKKNQNLRQRNYILKKALTDLWTSLDSNKTLQVLR